jgi:two-component system, NarL family, sensor kinase
MRHTQHPFPIAYVIISNTQKTSLSHRIILPLYTETAKRTMQPNDQSQELASLLRGNRELAVLYDIAGYLNHKVDVYQALQEVLVRVTELFGLRTAWIWLLNNRSEPYLVASQALPPYLANHPDRLGGSCLCLDTFLSGDLEGASNIDVLRCSRLKNAERDSDPSAYGLRYHASVPIYAGETPLGVLNVASEDWRELQEKELQLLHIISDQIGLAMQRARLSAEHTQAATRLATTEERNRMAREIHDTIAQGLAAITLHLETADALVEQRPTRAHEAIQRALAVARDSLEEARRSVMDLRAAPLQNRNLSEALAELAQSPGEPAVVYRFQPVPPFPALPARVEAGLYRIAQEALANARKHAEAGSIAMTLTANNHWARLIIQDDGQGFEPETLAQVTGHDHFGLTGMGERVKLLGGTLHILSEPGAGTRIDVSIPY